MSGSGTISIPGYDASNRVPGVYAAIDASKANNGSVTQRTLIIGQITAAGTATPNVAVLSSGVGDAQLAGGPGSILAIETERYRAIDPTGEVWYAPLADAAGSAAAVGHILYAGTATVAGVIPLYVNGFKIGIAVNSGDTAAMVATATVAAINNYTTAGGNPLDVIAVVNATPAQADLTARNKGTLGNQTTILLSFGGTANGEGQPGTTNVAGITATITQPTGGTTDPALTTLLANLPTISFDFIACPFNDATSLNALQTFLGDTGGRWNWSNELFGGVFFGKAGSLSTRTTFSTARNDQHAAVIGATASPSPDWHWGIDFTAGSAVSLRSDPAIPIGGLGGGARLNVVAPALSNRDSHAAQQTLLYDGFSTYTVVGGVVLVQRAITLYQLNPAGQPDSAYLNVNVPYQLMAYIRAWRAMISSNFNQFGLVSDNTAIPPGLKRTSAKLIKMATIALYQQLSPALVQNPDVFAKGIQSQNAGGGVVKLLQPVMLANQLITVVSDIQFSQP